MKIKELRNKLHLYQIVCIVDTSRKVLAQSYNGCLLTDYDNYEIISLTWENDIIIITIFQ